LQLNEHTPDLVRDDKNRFIYEPDISNGIVTWTIPNVSVGQSIMIGNPFMAHLNFQEFADINKDAIQNQYKMAYGLATEENAEGKVNEFATLLWSEANYIYNAYELSPYIAPMQAFVVTSKVTANPLTLRADINSTDVNQGAAFRSASRPANTLEISAARGEHVSKALLLYRENASHHYIPEEDSYKLFSASDSVSVMVFTRSTDGYALDINSFGDLGQGISIGMRTNRPGEIRLKFSGMESFGERTVIYLHDMQTGAVVNLSETDEYLFEKSDSELYLENRFFLIFSDATGIHLPPVANILVQQLPGQTVRIASDSDSPLGRIQIINIQGNVLVSQEVTEAAYTFQAPAQGIYIVRVNGAVRKLRISN
jgi:hypothetical protein